MFHIRQSLFHNAEHVEIGSAKLFRQSLAARIRFSTVALTFLIELLLLIKAADYFLQSGLHLFGDGTGLTEVLDHCRRKQADGRRIRLCLERHQERNNE